MSSSSFSSLPKGGVWLDSRFKHHVERCCGGTANRRETTRRDHLAQFGFARLRAQSQAHFLRQRGGYTHQRRGRIQEAASWSERQIDALPTQIRTGEFTLDDLLTVAKEAIEAGIVQPGFGFWPRLYKPQILQLSYLAYVGRLYDASQQKRVITQAALAQTYAFQRQLIVEKIMLANLVRP